MRALSTQSKNYVQYSKNQRSTSATLERFYPWLILTLSSMFLFYKYILQVSPSVMTHELMNIFHINGAGLGNLTATYFYAYLVAQLFVGPLLDKYNPRLLTSFSIVLCAAGAYAFSHAHSLSTAEASRALVGIGGAFATISYMKMASVWFRPNQAALIGGLLATAAMTGALFGEAPLALLVTHVGWRDSLLYCSLLGFAIATLFLFLIKDKPKSKTKPKPGNKIHPYDYTSSQKIQLRDYFEILKSKKNWLLTLYSGLAFAPVSVFGGLWGNPFLEETYHLGKTQAASFTSLVFFGLALGGPLLGFLSDRINKRIAVMTYGTLLSFVSVLVALYFPHLPLWGLGVALFLFGFGTGAFMLSFALGKDINKFALAATIVALINTGDAIFGAFTEPLVGAVLDALWHGKSVGGVHYFSIYDYHLSLSILPLYLFAGLLTLWFLRDCQKNN